MAVAKGEWQRQEGQGVQSTVSAGMRPSPTYVHMYCLAHCLVPWVCILCILSGLLEYECRHMASAVWGGRQTDRPSTHLANAPTSPHTAPPSGRPRATSSSLLVFILCSLLCIMIIYGFHLLSLSACPVAPTAATPPPLSPHPLVPDSSSLERCEKSHRRRGLSPT